jgi:hypothetical protein
MCKKIIVVTFLLVLSHNLYAKKFTVKRVEFEILFDKIPFTNAGYYEFKLLDEDYSSFYKAEKVLKYELNKYPEYVLKRYVKKIFYIVETAYNNKVNKYIDGIETADHIILEFDVLDISYNRPAIHHEIFHSILRVTDSSTFIGKIQSINEHISSPEDDSDCLMYLSDYITTYHPNAEEDICEMFSYLMSSKDLRYDFKLINWIRLAKSRDRELRNKVHKLIEYTKLISIGVMDEDYYFDLMSKDAKNKM